MKVKIGGHEVSFYDDISIMPVTRFQKWQKMLLVDGGIGSDVQSFDRHAARIIGYIHRGEAEKAVSEVEALRQGVIMAMKGVDTRKMSTLLLVSEVDGKPWTDDTDDGIARLSEMLSEATAGEIEEARSEAKKKIDAQLREYFPGTFDSALEKENYDTLAEVVATRARYILGEVGEDGLRKSEERMLTIQPPPLFSGGGFEVKSDKEFEDLCLLISQRLNADAKVMSVLSFYQSLEYIKREAKEKQKALSKYGK